MSWQPPPQPLMPQPEGPGGNALLQYVGTTEAVEGVVTELSPDGTYDPVTLTGQVTGVRFQAQDESTGTVVIDAAAQLVESGAATTGRVRYLTQPADTTTPRSMIA